MPTTPRQSTVLRFLDGGFVAPHADFRFRAATTVNGPPLSAPIGALRGEELLDAEAERGHQPWASPIDIARLLLMRSNPKTVRPEKRNSSPRILGVILPELEAVVAYSRTSLPSPANLILPLNLRPTLLAGIAIVERAGPAILEMLHAHTLGENRAHLGKLAVQMLAQNCMSVYNNCS